MSGAKMKSTSSLGRLLVVILNYKTAHLTINCLRSLQPELGRPPSAAVVVVDNASGDGPYLEKAIKSHGWDDWATLKVAPENGGFAAGNNFAIREALTAPCPPEFFLLLNSDTEVRPGALQALMDFMANRADVGIAGSGFENPDGSNWPIAFRFITPANQFVSGLRLGFVERMFPNSVVARKMRQDVPEQVDWVAGASMIVRREVFNDIGLLDEGYFLYFEEVDFCLRARKAGWPCWYVPQSRVMHIGGQSSGLVGISGQTTTNSGMARSVPTYWLDSRHRYFVKNYGKIGAVAADVAFGFGYASWRARRLLQRKPDLDPPRLLRDFLLHSLRARSQRRMSASNAN